MSSYINIIYFILSFSSLAALADPIPEIKVQNLKSNLTLSQKQDLADIYSDQFNIVVFAASWCEFCDQLFKEMKPISQSYNDKIRFIIVWLDKNKEDAIKKMSKAGFTKRHFWVSGEDPEILKKIQTLPFYFILNKKKQIDTVYEGTKEDKLDYFKKRIRELVAEGYEYEIK